jgi:hypothetical protein
MKSYEVTARIDASPEAVWSVLTDASGYTEWDSGVERVEGQIAPGAKISVFSKISPGRAFPVTVAELDANRRMVWSGGMPLGLFTGERTFTLSPEDGGTRFTMREEFSGLLPLIWRSMPDLGPSFEQFARGLKQQAEASAVPA